MTRRAQDDRQWAAGWAAAGTALDDVRARDLRLLSEDEALRTIEDLLSTVTPAELPAARRTWSGLVDLQRLLHRPSRR
ncbi:MAG: hypothetical protein FJW14_07240 [Acidimicrobiia bacterium]|nr:hypothetical protein [Acidimicrobiia bacterium]